MTFIAYRQTESGKISTMIGNSEDKGSLEDKYGDSIADDDTGFISRTLRGLFKGLENKI